MRYPKSIEYIEKIPNLDNGEYVYAIKDLGKTKRIIGTYTSVEKALKDNAFKEYSEVIFSTRKAALYNEYRCLFTDSKEAKKAHDTIFKLWKTKQEQVMRENNKSLFTDKK